MTNTQTATPSHPSISENADDFPTDALDDQAPPPAANGQHLSSSPTGHTIQMPEWARSAVVAEKPNIDAWWTPAPTPDHPQADPPIDGVLVWQGDIVDRDRGRTRRIYILREGKKRFFWGVSERSGITELRRVANGTKVFLACRGRKDTGNVIAGRRQTVLEFILRVQKLEEKPVVVSAPITDATAVPASSDADDVPF